MKWAATGTHALQVGSITVNSSHSPIWLTSVSSSVMTVTESTLRPDHLTPAVTQRCHMRRPDSKIHTLRSYRHRPSPPPRRLLLSIPRGVAGLSAPLPNIRSNRAPTILSRSRIPQQGPHAPRRAAPSDPTVISRESNRKSAPLRGVRRTRQDRTRHTLRAHQQHITGPQHC